MRDNFDVEASGFHATFGTRDQAAIESDHRRNRLALAPADELLGCLNYPEQFGRVEDVKIAAGHVHKVEHDLGPELVGKKVEVRNQNDAMDGVGSLDRQYLTGPVHDVGTALIWRAAPLS